MSALQQHPETTAHDPSLRRSLLRAEVLRLRSRRMVRVLLMLGVLALLAGIVVAFTQHAKPSAAGLADAAHRRQQVVAEQERVRAGCLARVGTQNGPVNTDRCGPVLTPDQFGRVEDFVHKHPFTLSGAGRSGVLGVAGVSATLAFAVGATYVGAEWSTRSMVALLFWEPRRGKVMATKLAVLTIAVALLGAVAEVVWLVAARVLDATRGTTAGEPGLWGQLVASAGRGVLLVVLAGLLGFGLANLIRNTAAALGAGFVYFAIVENVVRVLRSGWQQWLVTNNAVALLTRGGLRIYTSQGFVDGQGYYQSTGREITISNLRGGLLIAVVAIVVVAAGVVLFARRDLD